MVDGFKEGIEAQSQDKNVQRSEIVPKFISTLHKIPKQLVDTSQMVGVSEQLMSLRLNSGVLLASQVAHDKWLARFDGLVDAFWLFILVAMVSITGPNYFSIFACIMALWYWWFHIEWYSKAKEWETSITGTEYLIDTVKNYWISFILASSAFYLFLTFFIVSKASYIFQAIVAHVINFAEKGLSFIFSDETIKKLESSDIFSYSFSNSEKSQELSTEELKSLIHNGDKTVFEEKASLLDSFDITKIDVTKINIENWILSKEESMIVLDKYSIMPNIHIFTNLEHGKQILMFIGLIMVSLITYALKTKYDKHYTGRKALIDEDIEQKLKFDIENKMDQLENRL